MHLTEFAEAKASELAAAEVADTLKHLEAIWQGGLTDNGRSPSPVSRSSRRTGEEN